MLIYRHRGVKEAATSVNKQKLFKTAHKHINTQMGSQVHYCHASQVLNAAAHTVSNAR